MTFKQFSSLTEEQQVERITKIGTWLTHRRTREYKIVLYQVYYFYVEVCYHRFLKLRNIVPFEDEKLLRPYLKKIDLSELAMLGIEVVKKGSKSK
jgi:hypothetical protein